MLALLARRGFDTRALIRWLDGAGCVAGDAEIGLSSGAWSAVVAPLGASLRRLDLAVEGVRHEVLWGYSGAAGKRGGQGDVLLPWPNRIRGGRYSFGGKVHELALNDKAGPNAIHGFARGMVWEVRARSREAATFGLRTGGAEVPGYPFALDAEVTYRLGEDGLSCGVAVRNAGRTPAPFGVGFHPYVSAGGTGREEAGARVGAAPGRVDGVRLTVPAAQTVETSGLVPTGLVVPVELAGPGGADFRAGRLVGDLRLDHCFTGLAEDARGRCTVAVDRPDGLQVRLWMDARAFPYLMVFTGDSLGDAGRRALALEPMSCAPDAFNRPGLGLQVLAPGAAFTGTWGVEAKGP